MCRIWKHGVAVTVESGLDEKNVLGKQLFDVGHSWFTSHGY